MKDKCRVKSIISVILLLLTIAVNVLAAWGFINWMAQKEVSARYDTAITPAGFAFSIWGVIYLLLLIAVLMNVWKIQEAYYRKLTERTSYLFWGTCLLNIGWNVAFCYEQIPLSMIFILLMALSLVWILKSMRSMEDGRWSWDLAIGIYAGWLFIATFVNLAALFVYWKDPTFGQSPELFYAILLLIVMAGSLALQRLHRNVVFTLPIAWAFFGIWQANKLGGSFTLFHIVLIVGMVLMILGAAMTWYRERRG